MHTFTKDMIFLFLQAVILANICQFFLMFYDSIISNIETDHQNLRLGYLEMKIECSSKSIWVIFDPYVLWPCLKSYFLLFSDVRQLSQLKDFLTLMNTKLTNKVHGPLIQSLKNPLKQISCFGNHLNHH